MVAGHGVSQVALSWPPVWFASPLALGIDANFELQVETERVRRVEARPTAGRRGTTASTVEELDFRGRLESRAQVNAFSMLI